MSSVPQDNEFPPSISTESLEDIFLQGGLRRELGLEASDLEIGLEVARNKLNSGAPLEALRLYGALVLCDPENAKFQIGLANCAAHLNEHHLALQAASAVVVLAPDDPRGYYMSGNACMALGHYEEAREDLTDAVKFAKEKHESEIWNEATGLLEKLAILQEQR